MTFFFFFLLSFHTHSAAAAAWRRLAPASGARSPPLSGCGPDARPPVARGRGPEPVPATSTTDVAAVTLERAQTKAPPPPPPQLTMMSFTLCVTGLGLLCSSSARTRAKWLSCQMGRPSWLSIDNCERRRENVNIQRQRPPTRLGEGKKMQRKDLPVPEKLTTAESKLGWFQKMLAGVLTRTRQIKQTRLQRSSTVQ